MITISQITGSKLEISDKNLVISHSTDFSPAWQRGQVLYGGRELNYALVF